MKKVHPDHFVGTCVYLHRRATTNEIFYVGLGTRHRAMSSSRRNHSWQAVRDAHGYTVQIVDVFDNLQDARAAEIELIDLITQMGVKLANHSSGGEGGASPHTKPLDVAIAEAKALVAKLGSKHGMELRKTPSATRKPRTDLDVKGWLDAMWDKRIAKSKAN